MKQKSILRSKVSQLRGLETDSNKLGGREPLDFLLFTKKYAVGIFYTHTPPDKIRLSAKVISVVIFIFVWPFLF